MSPTSKRFYMINGEPHPRVTEILSIIDKSRPLMHWAVNNERRRWEDWALNLCARPEAKDPYWLLGELAKVTSRQRKAFQDASDEATNIGGVAHVLIEGELKRRLGLPAPIVENPPDASVLAFDAWKRWAKDVDFQPLEVETRVHCGPCAYAGTYDVRARVSGVVTICDWKTSKAVYPEAFLQNVAYRHAAEANGITSEAGLILRLPKTAKDPGFEAVPVPPMAYGYFLSACRLWRWKRMSENLPTGKAMTKCDRYDRP